MRCVGLVSTANAAIVIDGGAERLVGFIPEGRPLASPIDLVNFGPPEA